MELLWVSRWDCQVVGTMTNVLWNLPAFALTLWFPIYPKPFQLTKCFAVYNLGTAMAKSSLNPQQPSEVGVVWSCWNSRGQQESLSGWFWKYHPPTTSMMSPSLSGWCYLLEKVQFEKPGDSAVGHLRAEFALWCLVTYWCLWASVYSFVKWGVEIKMIFKILWFNYRLKLMFLKSPFNIQCCPQFLNVT